MFVPSSGILVQAALLVAGIGWCVIVFRRLPSDLAELREQWAKLRASKAPEAAAKFDTTAALRRHQKQCAADFWSTLAVQLCFFWPVTLLVIALFLVPTLWHIASRIVSALR